MYLNEEYFTRKSVKSPLVCYPENATCFLKAVKPLEYSWIQININYHLDSQRPPRYLISVVANPMIIASPDFSNVSINRTKTLVEEQWEWDLYEKNLLYLVEKYSADYKAISGKQALFSSWEMFIHNYDVWIANFFPLKIIDKVAESFEESEEKKLNSITTIENWTKYRYDKFYSCWRSIKSNLERGNYADWLAKIVNDFSNKK